MDSSASKDKLIASFMRHPRIVLALIAFMFALGSYLFVFVASRELLPDFTVYVRAAKALKAGENIYARTYEVEFVPREFWRLRYLYPPLLAHLLSKGLVLGEPMLRLVWSGVSFIALTLSVIQVAILLGYSWWGEVALRVRLLLVSFFFLCFEPLASGVAHGQVTSVVLCLLSTFMLQSVRRHERAAGLALALAICIKMTPVLLLVGPLVFRRWRTVQWCALGVAALSMVTILDRGGIDVFAHFAASLIATSHNPVLRGNEFNFAIDRVVLVPFGLFGQVLARRTVTLLMLGATIACVLRMPKRSEYDFLVVSGFLVVCMIMFSPIIWFHHFAWLLLPLTIAMMRSFETNDHRLKNLTVTVGIFFGVSKIYLLHTIVFHQAAALTGLSALVPTLLVVWLCCVLCADSRAGGRMPALVRIGATTHPSERARALSSR